MIVSVTGHTKGIGKTIYDFFQEKGYECQGFSRSNGYDILDTESIKKIVEMSKDSSIFVNNATSEDLGQFKLLVEMTTLWRESPEKIIINISSRAADFAKIESFFAIEYAKRKEMLDNFCKTRLNGPWIINLKPGYVDTDAVKDKSGPKMGTDSITTILKFILDNRECFKVSSITFTK